MSTDLSAATAADLRPAPDAAVRALTQAVARVHLPDTPRYRELTVTSNVVKAVRPLVVVEVVDADDVSRVLRIAAACGVPVAVAGTGHGATESMAGAILIHTAALDELTVHPEGRWARVGAGVRWAAVLAACAPHGLAGLCGSSTDVGVVGFLTGGGVGPMVRSHGLSSDSVRAFDVVTGDGVLRRATATENPDLFWGLRGGKGSLGVVTAVEIDLADQAEVYAGSIWFDGADATAVVRTWSVWSDLLPTEGTTSLAVMRLPDMDEFPEPLRGRTTIALRFTWTGDPAVGEEMIRAMRAVATPLIDSVAVMPYAALGAVHADPEDPMPLHETSLLLDDFGPDTADVLVELVGPAAQTAQAMVEVRQLGGRLRTGPDCAFAHREAAYQVFVLGLMIPEIAQVVAADARRITDALAPWARTGGLPNFTDTAGVAWAQRVYPPQVAARLRELSRAYDPAGVLLAARGVRG
ncbi:FAD-binding oxidoreductase [Cellulomonas edaphi]|uniref:FAD-binding oxidoreductase n=1 Tax=Cellulomonas edaphi TaxID=3053468 RepID=A0ABT7S9M7_9CELL|nr:FAD-binding oxidoreductase [Cellulomons edaphi]MDM7832316.1 FAD-binding oxidoreductase [Cellulomons edaphi]